MTEMPTFKSNGEIAAAYATRIIEAPLGDVQERAVASVALAVLDLAAAVREANALKEHSSATATKMTEGVNAMSERLFKSLGFGEDGPEESTA